MLAALLQILTTHFPEYRRRISPLLRRLYKEPALNNCLSLCMRLRQNTRLKQNRCSYGRLHPQRLRPLLQASALRLWRNRIIESNQVHRWSLLVIFQVGQPTYQRKLIKGSGHREDYGNTHILRNSGPSARKPSKS